MDIQFEVKCVDATANPYLALTALICAGINGIKRGLELNVPGCKGIIYMCVVVIIIILLN